MEECSEDNPRWQSILICSISQVFIQYGYRKSKMYLSRQRWRFQNYDPSKEEHRQNLALSQVPWSIISSLGNTFPVTNVLPLFAFCFLFLSPYFCIFLCQVLYFIQFMDRFLHFPDAIGLLMSDCDHIRPVCYLYRPKSTFTSRHIII